MPTPSLRGLRGSWLFAIPLLVAPALAQVDPDHPGVTWREGMPRPLADFDARLDAQGRPADRVSERNAELRTEAALAARATESRALAAAIPLLRIDSHPLFGTPNWVASSAGFLTAPVEGGTFDAVEVARGFVGSHPGLFEIAPEELDLARRARDFSTRHNGIRHLTFQQQIAGIDLFGAELRANVTRRGELINVSSTMLPHPDGGFAPSPIVLSPRAAIRAAADSIGAGITVEPTETRSPRGAGRFQVWASPDFRTGAEDVPLSTELFYFPMTREDIRPAWKVTLPEIGVGNTYEILVDATSGEILWRRNQLQFLAGGTQNITMRVYTSDSPAPGSPGNATPNGFQFPFVPRTLVTITPASVPESPNSWINDGGNDTQGNNVDAHLDLNADNAPDLPRPTGVPLRTFDFPQDNAMAPTTWRDAAVTNLFYYINRYHDRLYALGFDEASGNFQTDNFGLGGLGNDRVQGDAQDGSGTNNANFATPADGSSGRMQQYIFTGPTPDRDSDLDGDIVYHEFSHGLSNRLHGLALSGTQSGGMGEGWGDWFGITLSAEAGDDPNATYHTGGYATYQFGNPSFVDNYYYGIRRFPYSTDLNKNPQTYADTDPAQQSYPPAIPRSPIIGNTANEVHNVGEVWCGMLNEVRANLWATYGFAGNDLAMQLVVDGMKLDPANPNFVQARDAILAADQASSGGANLCDLWKAFAKRGCGFSAASPNGTSTSGIVEAFDLPVTFVYPNGRPTQLAPGQPTTFQVNISGVGSFQPVSGTGMLHVSVNGGAFTPIAMSETAPNQYDATLPAGNCFDDYRFYVSSQLACGNISDPPAAPATHYSAQVFTGTQVVFADDFQADLGWAASVAGATSGQWQRGDPVNDPSWAYDPIDDANGGGLCYLTQNVVGNTDVDNGSVTLTSPNFDMTGGADLSYSYYLNLTITDGTDRLLVEINSNGGAGGWTTIATHTASGGTSWQSHSVTAATFSGLGVPFTAAMKVRFTANDGGTQSIVEAGVDIVRVQSLLCDAVGTSFCAGDGSGGACPCTNFGDAGAGCDNSAGTGGAKLAGSGTTNPDTVVLTAVGELPTALTIFLQGTTSISPATYGDGLRCVGGTLKRLYAKNASGGQVSAPGGGDPSITSRSAALGDPIAPGSTRHYMTYYRDAASFCTSATFNSSQGLSIVW